jgi:hypothetical protein
MRNSSIWKALLVIHIKDIEKISLNMQYTNKLKMLIY